MIPAYNKMRCAAFPFETGIHFRRKTDFFSEEDTTKSYSGVEPKPTRLQAEGHSHHTGWATVDDRWQHHRSPPPQFSHGTDGKGNVLQSPALVCDSAYKIFEPTDLTSTYSVCTRRVFGGNGHRTQTFRSGAQCSNH
ncbi:hypothetical protein TNCV_4629381 [Trichonephila clavipes]|nr:hypothetical protein TNCV_4629381 [Trichonephila clavipes]